MYNFIVGMLLGSLLTILPLLIWDRVARSKAARSAANVVEANWRMARARSGEGA
jgi:hypothetical protein